LCVYIAQYQDFSAPNLVLQFSKSREMEEESVLKDLLPFLSAGGHGSARAQPAAAKPQTPTYPWPLLHTTRPEPFNPSKRAAIKCSI
jgi:hypothetical protein